MRSPTGNHSGKVVHVNTIGEPDAGKLARPVRWEATRKRTLIQGAPRRVADLTQTLFRWLDKQPLGSTHQELQLQVDQFDLIYNTERPHQGLPGRLTPAASVGGHGDRRSPRPAPIPGLPDVNPPGARPLSVAQRLMEAAEQPEAATSAIGAAKETNLESNDLTRVTGSITHLSGTGSRKLKVYSNGVVNIGRTIFSLTASMSGRTVVASWDADGVIFANTQGEVIAYYAWPPTSTAYVGITKSRALFGTDQKSGQLLPKS